MQIKKIILTIFALSLMACDKTEEKTVTESPSKSGSEIKLSSENSTKEISAMLNLNKNPIVKMVPVELSLNLKSGKEGIEKATVVMDLTMPDMTMPKNIINLKESLPGIYTGEAIFTMAGNWRLMTSVNYNNKKQDMFFDIKVQ